MADTSVNMPNEQLNSVLLDVKPNGAAKISSGIEGLDEVLEGGLIEGGSYLLSGGPGTGKTTLGFHFLTAPTKNGSKNLFITLSESEEQLRKNASYFNFNLDSMSFLDLSPSDKFFSENMSYDIFSPSEVEREPMTQAIMSELERTQPERVFIDCMTQLRYMSPDTYQFRKQVLSFIRYMTERGVTVMFSSEGTLAHPDDDLQFMCDGMLLLSHLENNRIVEILKMRGSNFRSGKHVLKITGEGIKVYPKLLPKDSGERYINDQLNSGVPELDELIGGGLERSTVTIITGPSGVGKTTLGVQFMKEAAGRGEASAIYTFEEVPDTLLARCEAIKIPVKSMVAKGTLTVEHIEPLFYSPDEFAYKVRNDVEEKKIRILMIDSISGYRLSMRGTDVVAHLHALCKYLSNLGITIILVNESETIMGEFKATEIGISYLADNIIYLRYLEVRGELQKAIGVLKKRLSDFEKTLRQFEITRYGLKVGKPLTDLRNILSGRPEFVQEKE